MSREKRALIEARLAQERPNRTLFVRNLDVRKMALLSFEGLSVLHTNACVVTLSPLFFCLQYNANVSEVKKLFDEYGDIQKLFSRIENRGMVFITYVSVFLLLINMFRRNYLSKHMY